MKKIKLPYLIEIKYIITIKLSAQEISFFSIIYEIYRKMREDDKKRLNVL